MNHRIARGIRIGMLLGLLGPLGTFSTTTFSHVPVPVIDQPHLFTTTAQGDAASILPVDGTGSGSNKKPLRYAARSGPFLTLAAGISQDGPLDRVAASLCGGIPLLTRAPVVQLSPTSLTFATQLVGTTSVGQAVTLTNTGNSTLTLCGIAFTGTDKTDFSQTNTCGGSLPPGGKCTITVSFRPSASGTRTADVSITDNAAGSPQLVTLTGTGTLVALSPTNINFVNQLLNTASPSQVVALTNTATSALNITGISITGTNSGDFAQTNTCGATVAAGRSCAITLNFTPTVAAVRNAGLSISDDGGGSPQSVSLTGTGDSPGTPDPLGTASASTTACPTGGLPGNCTNLTLSCSGVADATALIKVTSPSGASLGTVIFIAGGGGSQLYENQFTYGSTEINKVVQAGFSAAQIEFTSGSVGWFTGPGGPRKLACRFATAAQWVYDNVNQGSTTKGFCATGNSGGASAIGYALAHYGLGSILDMVEPTSGPGTTRVDYGCICNQPSAATPCGAGVLAYCFGSDASLFIDPAYNSNICSSAEITHDTTNEALFLSDSILAPDATIAFPTTDVHIVFGGLDTSGSVPQGVLWNSAITTKKTLECVADASHSIPDSLSGATLIANDVITYCKVQ